MPSGQPKFRLAEFVLTASASPCPLYAGHIILTEAFGDASRHSNRSLARPAMGLAVSVATYLLVRLRNPRLLLRISLWPLAALTFYLVFGAGLLALSLLVKAVG